MVAKKLCVRAFYLNKLKKKDGALQGEGVVAITQNRVMNFVYWCYEFFVSTVSFSVNGPCLCSEKEGKS